MRSQNYFNSCTTTLLPMYFSITNSRSKHPLTFMVSSLLLYVEKNIAIQENDIWRLKVKKNIPVMIWLYLRHSKALLSVVKVK